MNINHIFKNESQSYTIAFIESKRNWNVKKQSYRDEQAENCNAQLSECKIYKRGQYFIAEHNNIIHYWEYDGRYCFFKQAIELMCLDKPAKWKTIDKLIAFRMAIRQTEVNLCNFVNSLLIGKKMTHSLYNQFMALAREQDLDHHGQHTF